MQYEIKITGGSHQKKGRISLDRLAELADLLQEVAQDALQIRTHEFSKGRGRRPKIVQDGTLIELVGLREGSTILELQAPPILEQLPGVQLSLEHPEWEQLYREETSMSLVIKSFQAALSEEPDKYLDRPILSDMKKLDRVLKHADERIILSSGRAESTIILAREDFSKIKILEEKTPEPSRTVVLGIVDLLEHSSSRVKIRLADGNIATGYLTEELREGNVQEFWGKEATLTGTAYYRPSGKLAYLHIDQVDAPGEHDALFRRLPKSETVEQQISRQQREGKKANPLPELVGQWPGEETDEEFEAMLKLLRS